ncbi:unnamed protein product, partial [Ectocarpus sp. 13 AM-2016]
WCSVSSPVCIRRYLRTRSLSRCSKSFKKVCHMTRECRKSVTVQLCLPFRWWRVTPGVVAKRGLTTGGVFLSRKKGLFHDRRLGWHCCFSDPLVFFMSQLQVSAHSICLVSPISVGRHRRKKRRRLPLLGVPLLLHSSTTINTTTTVPRGAFAASSCRVAPSGVLIAGGVRLLPLPCVCGMYDSQAVTRVVPDARKLA